MTPSPASSVPASSPIQIPAAGPDAVYCTLYHREAGFAALAEAELRALGGGYSAEPGVWISSVPIRWAACGYGSAGGRQLAFATTLDGVEEQLRALRLAAPRFLVTPRRLPRWREGASAAKKRIGDCVAGQVSVDDPQLRLLVVVSSLGYRVLVDAGAGPGEADWLEASHKPQNYMVALPVRIARAMLNLTARPGDSVFDPFCGSGTIPLLAAWAGHRAYGSDISAECVARAAENLAHFGREATLDCVDARAATQTADCIVSNLPYGVYCHSSPESLQPILRNLGRLAPRVTLVTSARIEGELLAEHYEIEQVISVESERFERFVYVTRAPAAARCLR